MVATHLAAHAPIQRVQAIMGHEDINTTMIYVEPDLSQSRAVVSLHSPLNAFYGDNDERQE
jgi:site-specific recombinase XerD